MRRRQTAADAIRKNFFFLLDFVFDTKSAALWLILWILLSSMHAFLRGESDADIAALAMKNMAHVVSAIALLLVLAASLLPIQRTP